jgi:RecA/RadA recombinase
VVKANAYGLGIEEAVPALARGLPHVLRLGLSPAEIDEVAGAQEPWPALSLSLVMSHLACADDPSHAKNEAQQRVFDRLRARLPAASASLANSAGILLGPGFVYDLVRPGIALYGGHPQRRGPNPFRTVVHLRGRILQVREAASGETVGYGATRTLKRPSRIAVVAVGYADGLFRALSAADGEDGLTVFLGTHPAEPPRTPSGIAELDRVTGGGFVRGSVILIGGDPGIGKSTLLMQASRRARLRAAAASSIFRARRRWAGAAARRAAGASDAPVELAARPMSRTSSRRSRRAPARARRDRFDPDHVDRYRRIRAGHGDAGPRQRAEPDPLRQDQRHRGHPRRPRHQGRADRRAARRRAHGRCGGLVRGRQRASFPHHARRQEPLRPHRRDRRVRDDGQGARRSRQPLRAVSRGARHRAPGTAVFAGMEGTRPLLVEIQALVAPSALGTPRRAVVGWDPQRLSMVVAVLEAHAGLKLGMHDIYLNVAGGLRVTSRPAISPPPPRSSPRCRARPCRPIRSISARSACRERFARSRRRRRG